MALGLLYLGLTLLGALQTQAQDVPPTLIQAPPLSKIPLQPGFQDDQFQGNWFTISMAVNSAQKGNETNWTYFMSRATFQLNDDHGYNVITTGLSGQKCAQWNSTLVPYDQHGQFTLVNMTNSETERYTWRVAATDYNQFAMMYIEYKLENSTYFQAKLNGRTKELSSEVQECFFKFSKSLGLSEDHIIFFEPIEECIDG